MSSPNTLSLTVGIVGNGTLADASNVINPTAEGFEVGTEATQFPGDTVAPQLVLSTGNVSTSGGQANQWYLGQRIVNATTYDLLDIASAVSGLKNGLGQNINLSKVLGFLIVVNNHDGVQHLQVGPQGQSNAWQGPFSGVGADQYLTVYWMAFVANDFDNGIGPQPTGTTNILPVYNPTASTITYSIFVVGIQ